MLEKIIPVGVRPPAPDVDRVKAGCRRMFDGFFQRIIKIKNTGQTGRQNKPSLNVGVFTMWPWNEIPAPAQLGSVTVVPI
jgi:hypothetical protein